MAKQKTKKNPCLICRRHVTDLQAAFCRECWEQMRKNVPGMAPYDLAGSDKSALAYQITFDKERKT